jgi:hypothetical protein
MGGATALRSELAPTKPREVPDELGAAGAEDDALWGAIRHTFVALMQAWSHSTPFRQFWA